MQIPEKGTQSDTEFPQSYAEIFEKTVFPLWFSAFLFAPEQLLILNYSDTGSLIF